MLLWEYVDFWVIASILTVKEGLGLPSQCARMSVYRRLDDKRTVMKQPSG